MNDLIEEWYKVEGGILVATGPEGQPLIVMQGADRISPWHTFNGSQAFAHAEVTDARLLPDTAALVAWLTEDPWVKIKAAWDAAPPCIVTLDGPKGRRVLSENNAGFYWTQLGNQNYWPSPVSWQDLCEETDVTKVKVHKTLEGWQC